MGLARCFDAEMILVSQGIMKNQSPSIYLSFPPLAALPVTSTLWNPVTALA